MSTKSLKHFSKISLKLKGLFNRQLHEIIFSFLGKNRYHKSENPNSVFNHFCLEIKDLFVEKHLLNIMFSFLNKIPMRIFISNYTIQLFEDMFTYTDPTNKTTYQDIINIGCGLIGYYDKITPYEILMNTVTCIKNLKKYKFNKQINTATFLDEITYIYSDFTEKLIRHQNFKDLKLLKICRAQVENIYNHVNNKKILKELLKEFRSIFLEIAYMIRSTKWQ